MKKVLPILLIALLFVYSCKTTQQTIKIEQKQEVVTAPTLEKQDSIPLTFIDSIKAGYQVSTGDVFGSYYEIVDSIPILVKKIFPDMVYYYEVNPLKESSAHKSMYFRDGKTNMRAYKAFNQELEKRDSDYIPSFNEKVICFILIGEEFSSEVSDLTIGDEKYKSEIYDSFYVRKGSVYIDEVKYEISIDISEGEIFQVKMINHEVNGNKYYRTDFPFQSKNVIHEK